MQYTLFKQKETQMNTIFLNPRQFVNYWFYEYKRFKMQPNGNFEGNNAGILSTIWLDYKDLFRAECIKNNANYKGLVKADIEDAWIEFKPLAQKRAVQKIVDSLAFKKTNDNELKKWLTATIGKYTEFELAVMKHFLWQVKRKVFGKKVSYHMAPCFWGKQGGGKTEAIKKLIEPISELTMEWGINEAVDARNTKSLSENYVCLFDEMAGLQRVEIEALKRIISADHTSYRPMRTNDMITVKQNCTFVGISNKSLSENIYDPTGLRRFVELKCLEQLDWTTINSIKSLEVWQSIDENSDDILIKEFKTEMAAHQEELRIQDEMEHFVMDTNLTPIDTNTKEVIATPLYAYYKLWRQSNNYSAQLPLSQNLFGRKLRSYGVVKRNKMIDGKEKVVYTVNAASDIFKQTDTKEEIVQNLEWKQ